MVCAPAGFGKTSLLTAAFNLVGRRQGRRAGDARAFAHKGWVTLKPAHASVPLLAVELCTALAVPFTQDVTSIHAALEARAGNTALFLDNLDLARSPEADAFLDAFVNEAPDKLRIACAMRDRPQFSLVRLRLRGLLREIGSGLLTFSIDEMRRILDKGRPTQVGLVVQATQGWPALVALFSGLLRDEAADRGQTLAAWYPAAFEFLEEAVLSHVPPAIRDLLRSAMLAEDFSVELASAIGHRDYSGADARKLDDMEPVVTRSQIGPGWYRLHPVMRNYFAAQAPNTDGALAQGHATAARWFAKHGFLEQAVAHATQARDFQFAAETIRNAGGVDLFVQVGRLVLERLVEGLPADVIFGSPALSLSHALILAKRGRLADARLLVARLRDTFDQGGQASPSQSSLDHVEGIIAVYRDTGLAELVDRLERKGASLLPHEASDLAWINMLLCAMYSARGDLDRARKAAIGSIAHARTQKAVYSLIFAHVHLSLIGVVEGRFTDASIAAGTAQDLIRASYWNDSELTGISYVPTAELHYLRGELETAERLLTEALPGLSAGEGWVDIYARAFGTLACARRYLKGPDAAMAVLNAAASVAAERDLARLALAADIARIDMFVAVQKLETAARLAEGVEAQLNRLESEGSSIWRQSRDFALTHARLAAAQGRPEEALARLAPLIASEPEGYHHLLATLLSIRLLWSTGDAAGAFEALRVAIALARAHEIVQPFYDEGPELLSAIRAVIRRVGLRTFSADAVQFLGRVVGHAFIRGSVPAPSGRRKRGAPVQAGRSVLTERELQILGYLAEPQSNKQIARSLGVSEATVKFHLKNVFAKLGVSRRDMAASVARRLNLF